MSLFQRPVNWRVVLKLALLLTAIPAAGQTYTPGVTYYDRNSYIEYTVGELPIIVSAPHGGYLTPSELPDRTYGTFGRDLYTQELANNIRFRFEERFGFAPHVIINNLDRSKIDCNRDIVEGAQGNYLTEIAWNDFQFWIGLASDAVEDRHGRGFYIDLHGHAHAVQQVELGYLISATQLGYSDATLNGYEWTSSIETLSQESPLSFASLLRGSTSLGTLLMNRGFNSVPSSGYPDPGSNPFSDGGYNTEIWGSDFGGNIDGVQMECNYYGVRDSLASRTAFAEALASTMEKFFDLHYGVSLRESVPKLWKTGGTYWGTAANWYNGVLPVNTNHLMFAGPGGSLNNDLSSFIPGSITFSNGVTGSYTISGNSFSIVRGITNNSSHTQTLNNNITLAGDGSTVVAANSGPLDMQGNVATAGRQFHCVGNVIANGVISGSGGVTKAGAGTLDLTAVNTYTGPTTNSAGKISLDSNATFGNGTGALVLNGGEVLCLNTRTSAPIVNPILLTGSSTISGNDTITNSLRIVPFSGGITTTSGSLFIRHIGTNAFASNNVFRVRLTGGGFSFTRPLTVGFFADLPSTLSQLELYNDNLVGDQTFSGNISGMGQILRDAAVPGAAGRAIFSGANSYSGGTIVSAGTLLVNNSSGSGTGSGSVTVSNTGTLGGSGIISGPVWCAGTIAAGQSVGTLTLGGGLDLSAGGLNVWELSSLTTEGAGTSFDQLVLTGGTLALNGVSKLYLDFVGAATSPSASDPFWLTSHTWKIISVTGTATNAGATRFAGILNDYYPTGSFTNYPDSAGNVILAYQAVPGAPPTIQSVSSLGAEQFAIAFGTETNRSYALQYATNLAGPNWVNLQTNVALTDSLTLTNDSGGDPMRFYRVLVVP